MLIEVLKFLHILCALTLFGIILFNLAHQLTVKKNTLSISTDYLSLLIIVLLFGTASFLVIPKGYTFATPWINMAFTLLTLITLQVCLSLYVKIKKPHLRNMLTLNYGIIIIMLIMIIHDAVTKHTLWQ